MQVARQEIVEVLRALSRRKQADAAEQELPDPVDLDAHADLLGRYGLDGHDLSEKFAGRADPEAPGGLLQGEGV
jgi:hypothetical protein